MRNQLPARPFRHISKFIRSLASAAAIGHLLCGFTAAALSPEDLASISQTGYIPLTGDQEGDYPGKDYVVVETMRISRGQTVSFAAGTRLYFHPNAKITINGSLICEGTPAKPVIIGRLPFKLPKLSSSHAAMLLDSNTISVYRYGNISLHYTHLADSTVRIGLTDVTSTFTFDSVTAAGNRFSLPDTQQFFPANATVSCSKALDQPLLLCRPILPYAQDAKTTTEKKPLFLNRKLMLRVALGAGTIAAGGIYYYYNSKAQRAYDNWSAEDARARSLYANEYRDGKPDRTLIEQYRHDNTTALLYRNLAAAAGVCGLAGISITFFIERHDQ